jgi:hypothetical protein
MYGAAKKTWALPPAMPGETAGPLLGRPPAAVYGWGHIGSYRLSCFSALAWPCRVDSPAKRDCEGAEFSSEAGIAGAWGAAVHPGPDGVPLPAFPVHLDLGMLNGFDRARGEVVLAGGELDPDVDGGDLALAVPEVRPLRAGA